MSTEHGRAAAARAGTPARRWLFRAAALLLGLLAAEAALLALRAVSDRVDYHLSPPWSRITSDDPVLGVRPSPFYPEHDAWGFRNASVPERCDVLAVGDSMTYGYAAAPQESWPARLAADLGVSVYNASFGSYGPWEYLALVQQGMALEPRVVVVGVFPSNDLVDAFESAHLDDRARALASDDPAVLARLARAREHAPLAAEADRLLGWDAPSGGWSLRSVLSEHSSLWGLLRALRLAGGGGVGAFPGAGHAGDPFDVAAGRRGRLALPGPDRTVFLPPGLFALKLDPEDPRVQEGERILRAALVRIEAVVRAGSARLAVLVMPSKQVVYAPRLARMETAAARAMLAAARREEQVVAELMTFLDSRGIPAVDATPALRGALAAGRRPYPESDDEHPDAVGYAAIAAAIEPLVASLLQ